VDGGRVKVSAGEREWSLKARRMGVGSSEKREKRSGEVDV
jgi:hypothetical protein